MRAFFGGQINSEWRGDLAAIIALAAVDSGEQLGREGRPRYSVFVYPVASNEFVHLTGIMALQHPVERVYIGISPEAGRQIADQASERQLSEGDLRTIDRLVVNPHFLDASSYKPQRIVLESTSRGYEVVEAT